MSSEKTPNLQLHRWQPSDYVLRTEFNDNFAKIDDHAKQVTEQLAEKTNLADFNTSVSNLQTQKANKTEVRENTSTKPINVSEMDTETKALFTGGAVAVVGEKAVGEENIKLKSVGIKHLDFTIPTENLFDGDYQPFSIGIGTTPWLLNEGDGYKSAIVPIQGGSTYYVSKFDASNRFRIATSTSPSYPSNGSELVSVYHNDTASNFKVNTTVDDRYLIVTVSTENELPRLNIVKDKNLREFIPYALIKKDNVAPLSMENLSEQLIASLSLQEFYVDWEIGEIAIANGTNYPNDARVRSDYILVPKGTVIRFLDNTIYDGFYVHRYSIRDKTYLGNSGGYSYEYAVTEDCYVRLVSRFTDLRNIADPSLFSDKCLVSKTSPKLDKSINDAIFTDKYFINDDWSIGAIALADGTEYADTARVRTDFIEVRKGYTIKFTDNTIYDGFYLHLYSLTDKSYLGNSGGYVYEYAINEDCYIRLVSRYTDLRNIVNLSDFNEKCLIDKKINSLLINKPYLFGNFTEFYKSKPCEDVRDGKTFALRQSTITDLYNEYDDLMAENPNYITKNLLGYGGDVYNEQDLSLPIYEYVFSNPQDSRNNNHIKSPTILINTGTHGEEKSSVWSTLQFFKQLMEGWKTEDNLASIKSNVTFKVIPVLNPGGYNDNTRFNRHGVDLNRNFSYRWNETTSNVKGTEPYSELETMILRDWLLANSDAIIYLDYHNTGEQYDMSYLATPNEKMKYIYSNVMRRLSDVWRRDYEGEIDNNIYAFTTTDLIPCTIMDGIEVAGINLSATLEIAWDYNGVRYTSEVIERGVDLLANYLLALLHHYNNGIN